jgi:hypothetical protein
MLASEEGFHWSAVNAYLVVQRNPHITIKVNMKFTPDFRYSHVGAWRPDLLLDISGLPPFFDHPPGLTILIFKSRRTSRISQSVRQSTPTSA